MSHDGPLSLAVRVPVRGRALLVAALASAHDEGHTSNSTRESLICTAAIHRRVAGQPLGACPNHRLRLAHTSKPTLFEEDGPPLACRPVGASW